MKYSTHRLVSHHLSYILTIRQRRQSLSYFLCLKKKTNSLRTVVKKYIRGSRQEANIAPGSIKDGMCSARNVDTRDLLKTHLLARNTITQHTSIILGIGNNLLLYNLINTFWKLDCKSWDFQMSYALFRALDSLESLCHTKNIRRPWIIENQFFFL